MSDWPIWRSREQQGRGDLASHLSSNSSLESSKPTQLWFTCPEAPFPEKLKPLSPAPRIMVPSVAPYMWFYSRYKCSFQVNTSEETEEESGSLDLNFLCHQGCLCLFFFFESNLFLFICVSFWICAITLSPSFFLYGSFQNIIFRGYLFILSFPLTLATFSPVLWMQKHSHACVCWGTLWKSLRRTDLFYARNNHLMGESQGFYGVRS